MLTMLRLYRNPIRLELVMLRKLSDFSCPFGKRKPVEFGRMNLLVYQATAEKSIAIYTNTDC